MMGGGSSYRGGGGLVGGGYRGGGGVVGGYRGGYGGYGGYGFRGGFYGGYGFGLGLGFGYGYGYPYYGYYSGYDYGYPYSSYYPDTSYGYQQPAYQPAYQAGYQSGYPSQNVNVVYPPSQPAYADRATPVMREYDQYGQQVQGPGVNATSSPIYLIALKNHNIVAASSYTVNGPNLQYVTIDHAEKQVALSEIDPDLSMRLNRERHVAFQLPAQ
jgi:hypothetical protein